MSSILTSIPVVSFHRIPSSNTLLRKPRVGRWRSGGHQGRRPRPWSTPGLGSCETRLACAVAGGRPNTGHSSSRAPAVLNERVRAEAVRGVGRARHTNSISFPIPMNDERNQTRTVRLVRNQRISRWRYGRFLHGLWGIHPTSSIRSRDLGGSLGTVIADEWSGLVSTAARNYRGLFILFELGRNPLRLLRIVT